VDPYIKATVSDFPRLTSHPRFLNMPNPRTPPHSQSASIGSVLSKPTPLKRDISGSEAHSSTPPSQRASDRYQEMTLEACEKFVGPMPIDQFLSEFVPQAPNGRPANEIMFSHSSVSQNEDEFVRPFTITGIFTLTPVMDRFAQSRNLLSVQASNLSILLLAKTDNIL
jgi:hypothetical protein